MKRLFIIILILSALISCGPGKPEISEYSSELITAEKAPEQFTYEGEEFFVKKTKPAACMIRPKAEYYINARVLNTKKYKSGWTSAISPVDFALGWGPHLSTEKYDEYIKFSQSGRWYYFKYEADCPLSEKEIQYNSSNHHIIPATDNVWKAVLTVKKNDLIYMQGYLVRVEANTEHGLSEWISSLTRKDSGDRSCEVFYVDMIQIEDRVYR